MNKTIRAILAALVVAILIPTIAYASYNRGGILALTDNIKLADSRYLYFGDYSRNDNPAVGDVGMRWDGSKLAVTAPVAAAVDFDGVAYLQLDSIRRTIANYTTSHTCTATESGYVFSNVGTTEATFSLPAATNSIGFTYKFLLASAATATIAGVADKLVAYGDASASAIVFSQSAQNIGSAIEVTCNGHEWISAVTLAGTSSTYSVTP